MKIIAFWIFVFFIGIYSEIFALQVPLFSLLIFPISGSCIAILYFLKYRPSVAIKGVLIGPPAILIIYSLFFLAASRVNDGLVMSGVQSWGRNMKDKPPAERYLTRRISGYRATFISNDAEKSPVIIFDKFKSMRQAYYINTDKFEEEYPN